MPENAFSLLSSLKQSLTALPDVVGFEAVTITG